MFSMIRKLLTRADKDKSQGGGRPLDRRAAKRAEVPDTSDVTGVGIDATQTGKKKNIKLPDGTLPKGMEIVLSKEEHEAEEKKARQLLDEQLHHESASKQDDPFGFSISLPTIAHDAVHQTIAVSLPELGAACLELKKAMRVKDISTTGIGLIYEKPRVKSGTELTLILATQKARLATNLKATAIRHEKGVLGARFHDLTRQQENLLSKLVLEGQKRQRANRKKKELPPEIQNMKL